MSLTTGKRIASVSVKSLSKNNGGNGKLSNGSNGSRTARAAARVANPVSLSSHDGLVVSPVNCAGALASAPATARSSEGPPGAVALGRAVPHLAAANGFSLNGAGADAAATCPIRMSVVAARPGEQVIARQLLAGALRGPSAAEFQAQLDDPFFEPTDRLFCQVNDVLVGHVRLVKREMRFGTAAIPVTMLADLLVLPEFQRQSCGGALLAEAEREMMQDGSLLGMVRTNQPTFFLRRGWCAWTRHSFSVAGARGILSRLLEGKRDGHAALSGSSRRYNIRLWRQIELGSLIDLYDQQTRRSWGPFVRTPAYWQWLLSRHSFDRIYVAMNGPDPLELGAVPPIVGYAVMKEGRILELVTAADYPDAGGQLLARACADAIEQDTHYVRLDAPVADPLHQVLTQAGGELAYHESHDGEVCLVKVLDIRRTMELLSEQFIQRAKDSGFTLPIELGLQSGGEKLTLELRPRSARLKAGRSCRSFLECSPVELTQLMLGHLDLGAALATHRLAASTRVAAELAAALFPRIPLWRPPWDELEAE